MKHSELKMLKDRIIPPVKSLTVNSQDQFKLESHCQVTLKGKADDQVAKMLQDTFRQFWSCDADIALEPGDCSVPAEGYELTISPNCLTLTAGDEAGFLNGLRTCRQLSESSRGTATVQYYILPCVSISDSPSLRFRGLHLCWFPETPAWQIEKQLRLAAYYKFNYVVLESWGVIELTSHPEFCWQEFKVPQSEVKRLVALAKDLHVTLIPQVNIFGHGTAARSGTGKHVLLDFHPEYASLYEPDGWTWCISNPATRAFLTDIVMEIYTLFDCPPFFHVGCDEAENMGTCALCRSKDYGQVFIDHLTYFRDLLAAHGARIMLWHDMLLNEKDERWKDYIVHGQDWGGTENLCEKLPHDIIVCDWQYGYPKGKDGSEPTWCTTAFFAQQGFDVLVSPWFNEQGISSLGTFAEKQHLFGMLETTWHFAQSFNLVHMFYYAARAAWNPQAEEADFFMRMEGVNRHMREMGHDQHITRYEQTGTIPYQVSLTPYQGQSF